MNIQTISNKIKELLYLEREMSKGGETASVFGHVRLFAVLTLQLEETNKLLAEQNALLTKIAANTASKEASNIGPG